MRLVFDIETNGLLKQASVIHSLVIYNLDTQERGSYADRPNYPSIDQGLDVLQSAHLLIGHNITSFDLPAILKITKRSFSNPVFDTLLACQMCFTEDMYKEGNSLKVWGQRLKIDKLSFKEDNSFDHWSEEMQRYCERDVEINTKLFNYIEETKRLSSQALELETSFKRLMDKQENYGISFDMEKALALQTKIGGEITIREKEIQRIIPFHLKRGKLFTPKKRNSKTGLYPNSSFIKISYEKFNPNSRPQILEELRLRYGWETSDRTEKNAPQLKREVLASLPFPEAKILSEYLDMNKAFSMLSEGDTAWLKCVQNSRIHGKVFTLGTVTGRCSHNSPNLAQVPSKRSLYGNEFRTLFHSPKGWIVGADASGIELRCFAHYLGAYDEGNYGKAVVTGDVHTLNMKAAGLPNRDSAKTFIYAFLYGAGQQKLGSILKPEASKEQQASIGAKIKNMFLRNIAGIEQLVNQVKRIADSRGYLTAIDGRYLYIRSSHLALNTLLQSCGAIIMKRAAVIWAQKMEEMDLSNHVFPVLNVHDEIQCEVLREDLIPIVGQILVDSIKQAGEFYNLRVPLDGEYKYGKNWAQTH